MTAGVGTGAGSGAGSRVGWDEALREPLQPRMFCFSPSRFATYSFLANAHRFVYCLPGLQQGRPWAETQAGRSGRRPGLCGGGAGAAPAQGPGREVCAQAGHVLELGPTSRGQGARHPQVDTGCTAPPVSGPPRYEPVPRVPVPGGGSEAEDGCAQWCPICWAKGELLPSWGRCPPAWSHWEARPDDPSVLPIPPALQTRMCVSPGPSKRKGEGRGCRACRLGDTGCVAEPSGSPGELGWKS